MPPHMSTWKFCAQASGNGIDGILCRSADFRDSASGSVQLTTLNITKYTPAEVSCRAMWTSSLR